MSIPGEKRCLELLEKYKLAAGIVEHSVLVAKVAVFLAEALKRSLRDGDRGAGGETGIDVDLVRAGALLHDIGKTTVFSESRSHAENGALILEREGHGELAEIVRRHLVDAVLEPSRALETWEQKLVFYADKVVTREVISLRERFGDLRARYPQLLALFEYAEPLVLRLEDEIFSRLDFTPADMVSQFA